MSQPQRPLQDRRAGHSHSQCCTRDEAGLGAKSGAMRLASSIRPELIARVWLRACHILLPQCLPLPRDPSCAQIIAGLWAHLARFRALLSIALRWQEPARSDGTNDWVWLMSPALAH